MRQLHVSHPVIYFGKFFLVAELSEFGLPLEGDIFFFCFDKLKSTAVKNHDWSWNHLNSSARQCHAEMAGLHVICIQIRAKSWTGNSISSKRQCHANKWIWRTGTLPFCWVSGVLMLLFHWLHVPQTYRLRKFCRSKIGDELPLPRAGSLHITRRIGNNMCVALPRLCACMSEGKPPWGGGNCDTKTSTSGTKLYKIITLLHPQRAILR